MFSKKKNEKGEIFFFFATVIFKTNILELFGNSIF